MTRIDEMFPYLAIRGAAEAMAFYARVFGAEEEMRLTAPDGSIAHAQMRFGPATIMMAEESVEAGFLSPLALGGTSVVLHLHVDDVDAVAARAVEAGATILRPPRDEMHGERQCKLRDPFGHAWLLGADIGLVTPEEMQHRLTEAGGG